MALLKAQPGRNKAKNVGISANLYIAPVDLFQVIQKPAVLVGAGVSLGDEATIVTAHTFKTATPANGFVKIPLVGINNGKFEIKTEGEFPAEKIVSSFEGIAVGLSAEQLEMIKRLKGQNMIVLLEDAECENGKVYQLGCDCKPVASLKFDYNTDDNKLKISGSAECIPNIYTGAITLMA